MWSFLFVLSQVFLISNTINYYVVDFLGKRVCVEEEVRSIEVKVKNRISEIELFVIGFLRLMSFTSVVLIFGVLILGLFYRF